MENFIKNVCRLSIDRQNYASPTSVRNVTVEELYRKCQYHQIAALVYHFREELESLYPDLQTRLYKLCQKEHLQNLKREMVMEEFLGKLSEVAREEELDFYLLKGISLGKKLYSPSYLRTFNDIDLLIDARDISAWKRIMHSRDLVVSNNLYSQFSLSKVQKYGFPLHFFHRENRYLAIDLHPELSNYFHPYSFPKQTYLQNYSYYCDKIKTINNTNLVPYLLFHTFKHDYFKLIWFIDLYLLLENCEIDFERVDILLQKSNMKKLWALFLALSQQIFGRKPSIPSRYRTRDFDSNVINKELIIGGEPSYKPKISRLALPIFYLDNPGQILNFLFKQFWPPIEIVVDRSSNMIIDVIIYIYARLKKLLSIAK